VALIIRYCGYGSTDQQVADLDDGDRFVPDAEVDWLHGCSRYLKHNARFAIQLAHIVAHDASERNQLHPACQLNPYTWSHSLLPISMMLRLTTTAELTIVFGPMIVNG
jgi:hypothetical protein